MSFEKFTETARSYKSKLSLRVNGTIGLNAGAVTKFHLESEEYVILYYDRERKMIGMKPTKNETDEGAHKINRGKTGAWIAARRFLDYYGVVISKTQKYEASWDEKDKMIVAQLT